MILDHSGAVAVFDGVAGVEPQSETVVAPGAGLWRNTDGWLRGHESTWLGWLKA